MNLRLIGAGIPRTGTASLRIPLGQLLGGRVYHKREIPGHPFPWVNRRSEWIR